ncbi:MAG: family efflux transporter permease subunit [Nocardioidaceae bacterium]|nr:family efflux transporter permease subunit [Nocardioidaceae bacterium]
MTNIDAVAAGPARGSDTPADLGVLRWLVAATFIVILNETILVNAIPRLMTEFDVTARAAQWLSTAFMLTMAVVIPVTGWFLQRVTTRAAFAVAMTTFCAGTLLAAVAPTFGVLLAARVVQASGTAVMMPLLMTTLMTIVPAHDRGRVMGNVTLAMSVAPALGPAVSGVVLQLGSWRWMFGLVLPVAAAIGVVGLRRLVNVGVPQAGSVDWASVGLSAVGFGGFVYGLTLIGSPDAPVPPALAIVGGAAAVGAFVWRQLVLQRSERPLLDLRTLRIPTYAVALSLMAIAFMAMLGSMILLPLYLQDVRGLTALQTGLLVAPGGIAMGLLGPKVGRVFDRYGSRPLVVPGAVGIAVALGLFTQVDLETPIWSVLVAHVLLMVSLAAVFTPVFTVGLGALPMHLYSHGSSLLGASQQVAAAIGTAIVVTVLSSRTTSLAQDGQDLAHATVGGMQWAFAVGAVLSLLVLGLAFFLPNRADEPAAPATSS